MKQHGDSYEENTKFIVTDHAVTELAPFITGQILAQSVSRGRNQGPIAAYQSQNPLPSSVPRHELPDHQDPILEQQDQIDDSKVGESVKGDASPLDTSPYFLDDEGTLVATITDFKGEKWADQQRNFIVLYGWSYERMFKRPVPTRDSISESARKIKILDPRNFSTYLNTTLNRHFTQLSSGFRINDSGLKEAERIIILLSGDESKSGYDYLGKSNSVATKRHRTGKGELEKVKEWATEEVDIGLINVNKIDSPRDYALLSLWIITEHLSKQKTVKWSEAFHYFKEKFTTMTSSPQSFSRALKRDSANIYFKEAGGSYFLTPTAKDLVDSWVQAGFSPSQGAE